MQRRKGFQDLQSKMQTKMKEKNMRSYRVFYRWKKNENKPQSISSPLANI